MMTIGKEIDDDAMKRATKYSTWTTVNKVHLISKKTISNYIGSQSIWNFHSLFTFEWDKPSVLFQIGALSFVLLALRLLDDFSFVIEFQAGFSEGELESNKKQIVGTVREDPTFTKIQRKVSICSYYLTGNSMEQCQSYFGSSRGS